MQPENQGVLVYGIKGLGEAVIRLVEKLVVTTSAIRDNWRVVE